MRWPSRLRTVTTKGAEKAEKVILGSRLSPFRPGAFRSSVHSPRTATVVGRLVGLCLVVCFLTGLYSHYLQNPSSWMVFLTRPIWLYRLTQGVHIATGIAAIPLLLAKLWTVYPTLFEWPPLRSLAHGLERLSIAVLISAALLQLFMGLLNTMQWYPWPFSFRPTHFFLAWIIIGSLMIHIAAKLPLIAENWRRKRPLPKPNIVASDATGWSRRGFLTAVGVAVGAVTVTTVGQSLTPLGKLVLLGPRKPHVGPQGLPITRTAAEAQVLDVARSPDWTLRIDGPKKLSFTLAELNSLPQHEVVLPISCVDGWSQSAHWGGVRVRDLMDRAGAPHSATLRIVSLQQAGSFGVSEMGHEYARDDLTLLALRLNGGVLHIEHGYPARVIAPGRPGVLQTKWVHRIEVMR